MWRALTLMLPATSLCPEAGMDAFEAHFEVEVDRENWRDSVP